jgi:hypothetical protein
MEDGALTGLRMGLQGEEQRDKEGETQLCERGQRDSAASNATLLLETSSCRSRNSNCERETRKEQRLEEGNVG